jgi:hypothetical protein
MAIKKMYGRPSATLVMNSNHVNAHYSSRKATKKNSAHNAKMAKIAIFRDQVMK